MKRLPARDSDAPRPRRAPSLGWIALALLPSNCPLDCAQQRIREPAACSHSKSELDAEVVAIAREPNDRPAKLAAVDGFGNTLLHRASRANRADLVKLLVECGADV